MNSYIKNLPTPIAIVGLGKSGEAALELLLLAGVDRTNILTFDANQTNADYTQASDLLAKHPKTIVLSPGVPLALDWIQSLINNGTFLCSEIDLACSFLQQEKIIGITGSIGKSTTTDSLGFAIRVDDPHCFVGGNLGTPFSQYAIDLIKNQRSRAKWIVLELSSYQLENCVGLKLTAAAITYLSPNHLERYNDLSHYYLTKFRIFDMTQGKVVLNEASQELRAFVGLQHLNQSKVQWSNPLVRAEFFKSAKLIGSHNKQNLSVALSLLEIMGASNEAKQRLCEYSGLPHRMENLGTHQGVLFINDSKATAMDSVVTAARSCLETNPNSVWLLLGGKDKNLPWEELSQLNSAKIKPVFFGACRERAQQGSGLAGESFAKLGDALQYVFSRCQKNDIVLLSPGGTSLDEFKNFEERGNFFKAKLKDFLTNS